MTDIAQPEPIRIELDSFNLHAAERRLCEAALERAGSVVGAAALLGVTRHALRRRMIKLRLKGAEQALLPRAPAESLQAAPQSSDPID